ncbi:MAG: hypothetical protein RR807_05965 [Oscillospiraceae bacterium]
MGEYRLFPTVADWKGKILLLETSEEQPTPEKCREMLLQLKHTGIFGVLSGILAGKPMDETYTEDFLCKRLLILREGNLAALAAGLPSFCVHRADGRGCQTRAVFALRFSPK